jgi:phospholipase C
MARPISRRQFLTSAGGLVLASAVLPPNLRRTLTGGLFPAPTSGGPGTAAVLSQIKHVVVLMQENRSFDHYFGAMPGVRGFADPSVPASRFYQPDPTNPDKYLLPFHVDTQTSSAQALPSNSHAWAVQHESWNSGAMNGFVTSHLTADGVDGQYTMAYFTQDDIPFHWALADAFTICDGYHCSMLGPTWPNRLFLMTGTVDPQGGQGGPVSSNTVPSSGFSWTTYPEMLTAAGVSWRVYQENDNYGLNVLEYFDQYQSAPTSSPLYQGAMRFYGAGQFEHDAAHDQLPTVSWILPTSYQSEHPNYMPASGADFIASKVNAIASNPDVWASTVFILVYDENDGFFDHVTPPTAPPGTPDEYITVYTTHTHTTKSQPIGLGFRVPCIVVSPWTVGGYVSHDVFDHTSVIRVLETLTGVKNPNISTWRRQTVGDFTSVLGCRPAARVPLLPATAATVVLAEQEVRRFQLPPIPGAQQTFPTQGRGQKQLAAAC